jgi:hypothetical protein
VILNLEGARIHVTFCMGNFATVCGQAISAGVFIGVGPGYADFRELRTQAKYAEFVF